MGEVAKALFAVLERGSTVPVQHDAARPSPCEVPPPDADGMIGWRPIPIDPPPDFADLEAEAGLSLHPDVKDFYGSFWGGSVEGRHSGEPVILTVAWNQRDLAHIKRSIIAHLRVCAEYCTPATVFVAVTTSDWFFSIDNVTGDVLLEEPGHPRLRSVAPSLAQFLVELYPTIRCTGPPRELI